MPASSRRAGILPGRMNRLYAVESSPTVTGAAADHRLPLRVSDMDRFARALARQLGVTVERRRSCRPATPAVAGGGGA